MDHYREGIRYKEIWVQVPSSLSNKCPRFFTMCGVKHRYMQGYLLVSNQFTFTWVGNRKCLRNVLARLCIEARTSGLIVQRSTTTPLLYPLTACFMRSILEIQWPQGHQVKMLCFNGQFLILSKISPGF